MNKLLVHQIAPKDHSLWHPFWHKCHESWKQHHEVVLWNDADEIDLFVQNNYPAYWNLYQLLPFHVMKIDFVRYCILHHYGGLYADMDIFCYKELPTPNKDFIAIENLTEEFTSARYENSMMYATKDNEFLLDILKYVKMLFINSRPQFEKPYRRTVNNDTLINNITGSGMLEAAIQSFNPSSFGFFPTATYNNRPASYDPSFFTKHAHTSIWGKEYITKQNYNELVIMDGVMYQVDTVADKLKDVLAHEPHTITNVNEFDFHTDYTNGNYLKDDNLEELKNNIADAEHRFRGYFYEANKNT